MSDWREIVRTRDGVPEVSPEWLAPRLGTVRLVDVRGNEERMGPLGKIDPSECVPMETLVQRVAAWDRQAPLILYCRSGNRSGVAAMHLERLGFSKVASLRGGMLLWNERAAEANAAPGSARP
jgi:rhodanese-related sulfurtransferase